MGKDRNVKIAGYVYHFLMGKLVSLWHDRQGSAPARNNGKNSYWMGVLNGFREGLENDRQATPTTNGPPAPAKENRLPAAANDRAMSLFVADRYPRLKNSRRRTTRINLRHFEAGRQEGRLLQLRKGLDDGGGEQKFLAAAPAGKN
jgi:hypothetical protein